MLKRIMPYYKLYKNWLTVLYSIYRKDDHIELKLRSGKILNIELSNVFDYTFENYYDFSGGYIKINKFKFKLSEDNSVYNGDIGATFIREDYKWLRPKGNIVIDVGANIGDSSIYFASRGAFKVIALEPFPYSYRLARENILNNGYGQKIVLLNAGYGKDSEITVEDRVTGVGDELVQSKEGVRIKIFSLKNLLNIYSIDSALLKIDCEGCEYNLINEDDDTLHRFKRIQIEYHYGYERLKRRLDEAGFKLKYTEPTVGANNKNMRLGYIYAKK